MPVEGKPTSHYCEAGLDGGSLTYVGRVAKTTVLKHKYKEDEVTTTWYDEQGLDPSGYKLSQVEKPRLIYDATAKYGGPCNYEATWGHNEVRAMHLAIECVTGMLRPYMVGKIATMDEIISELELTKSPGFPWNRMYTTTEQVFDKHMPEIAAYIEDIEGGLSPLTYWNIFPKEEVLPATKVDSGRLRQIAGCGAEFKVLANKYFLHQNKSLVQNHQHIWASVGIDFTKGGWHVLYHYLNQVGGQGTALDVSRFDVNLQSAVADAVKTVRLACFPDDVRAQPGFHAAVRYIYHHIYQGFMVCPFGEVVQKEHGNASGSPLTSYDNTIANMIALCFTWFLAVIKANPALTNSEIIVDWHPDDYIRPKVYGDDNTMGVSETGQALLTQQAIENGYNSLGWTVTFETPKPYVPVKELVFLSRGFVQLRGPGNTHFWAPQMLDHDKALASLKLKGKGDPVKTYERACGLLTVYWTNKAACTYISRFLDYLERHHISKRDDWRRIVRARPSLRALLELYAPQV